MNSSLKKILKFRDDRDWKQFHLPKNLAISVSIEANEILELFQWTKDGNLPNDALPDLEKELADTYYYLLLLANEFKIDLSKALDKKMIENESKYPINLSKGNSIKYNKRKVK